MTKGQRARMLSADKPAYLSSTLHTFSKSNPSLEGIAPLAGISKVNTVLCKEDSGFVEYVSDRYGFNNEDSLWESKEWEVLFLGDSFVHGFCVPREQHFLFLLKEISASQANLGLYGAGPLSMLGALQEYAQFHKPKRVIWVYLPTHLANDFDRESNIPALQGYLENKTQNLRGNQQAIDNLLLEGSAEHLRASTYPNWAPIPGFYRLPLLLSFLERWAQRMLHLPPKAPPEFLDFNDSRAKENLPRFLEVLSHAQMIVQAWGGEMVFLVLPDANSFHPEALGRAREFFPQLRHKVEHMNIPVWDFYEELAKEPNPFLFYAHLGRRYGHFNASGYAKLAGFLRERLKAPGQLLR